MLYTKNYYEKVFIKSPFYKKLCTKKFYKKSVTKKYYRVMKKIIDPSLIYICTL